MSPPTMNVCTYNPGDISGDMPGEKLGDVIMWFQEKLKSVPLEYREIAEVEFNTDEYSTSIRITYERPETAEERAEREGREKADLERHRLKELDTLRRLKLKYESV
ncbi:hypothetical protein [Rhodopila sp.]|uniref:hypothetical protein n=1 Tax=Rhodopila sp. TaxID=2480087 RepID=UPI003D0BF59F